MHRSPWLGLATLAASSCTTPAPPLPPGVSPIPLVASSAPAAPAPLAPSAGAAAAQPPASAKAAAAPRVLGCEPRGAVQVPKLFRALFEKGRRTVYAMHDEVDPHGQDGRLGVTNVKVECVVRRLRRFRSAVQSEIECKTSAKESPFPGGDLIFLANDRSLWMSTGISADDEEDVAKMLAEPPLLAATPMNERRTKADPGLMENQPGTCDTVVDVGAVRVCSNETCNGAHMYGPTQERLCFSAAQGFESWRRANLGAPQLTTWAFVNTKQAAPLPAETGNGVVPPCAD